MGIKVSKEFLADFDLVMKHYECSDEEIQDAKESVRKDYEGCKRSYAEMAKGLRSPPSQEEKVIKVSDLTLDKKEEVKPKKQTRKRR